MRLNLRGQIKRLIYQAILSTKLYAAQIFYASSIGSLHPHLLLTLYFRSGILNIIFTFYVIRKHIYYKLGKTSIRKICGNIIKMKENMNIWSILADNDNKQLHLVFIFNFKIPSRNTCKYIHIVEESEKKLNESKTIKSAHTSFFTFPDNMQKYFYNFHHQLESNMTGWNFMALIYVLWVELFIFNKILTPELIVWVWLLALVCNNKVIWINIIHRSYSEYINQR